ncbi:ferredoxin [Nocardioides sp. zg-579]|uniref:Ferredoxin n=1 Tax=Nocardioides marmotae TaxID=2663857 RepID=A0A6I3J783_9ACTN|nr:ferredoxin [Nocardioides marmotae]MCR6030118.1 ferredoxin [Gordonia jinghuaiqii]MTB93749.1 ferredoxin [Nocardioides marmotae]QKE00088.1 ferredoxin [Nocardioides marmotae]
MRVLVDTGRCEGYGICVKYAPEVFSLGDDDDWVQLLVEEPAGPVAEKAVKAAKECPMGALTVED